ncbi:hypothetical protein V8G54_008547 [Vigna mungo]|uniref:Uncharacterized protein n=1 Tax=Vigna mungo TaxID=3915 RepID=A0AAQ3P412_VIGMU
MKIDPRNTRIVCCFQKVLTNLRQRKSRREPTLHLIRYLATKLHCENASLAHTLPRERNQHLKLNEEASPSGNRFEIEFATWIFLVRNPNTLIFNAPVLCHFFQSLVGYGLGRGIQNAKGRFSSARVGAEGREERKRESALELKRTSGRKSLKAVRRSGEGKRG